MNNPIITIAALPPERTNASASNDAFGFDEAQISRDTVFEKLADAQTPGYQAEFAPDEAEAAGAFSEDALSEDDALASTFDYPIDDLHGATAVPFSKGDIK